MLEHGPERLNRGTRHQPIRLGLLARCVERPVAHRPQRTSPGGGSIRQRHEHLEALALPFGDRGLDDGHPDAEPLGDQQPVLVGERVQTLLAESCGP
jgi:hypothetical protein